MTGATDLIGNSRIIGGTVNMGAYEGTVSITPPPPTDNFRFSGVALTNNTILRWSDPTASGYGSASVMLRFGTDAYPATPSAGTQIYTGTGRMYQHTGLTPGTDYYYSIFVSNDGSTYIVP